MQRGGVTLAASVKLDAEAAGLVEYCSRTLDEVFLQRHGIDLRLAGAGRDGENETVRGGAEEKP